MVPYDLVKELAIALGATAILVVVLAAALSSPDVPSDTIQRWAQDDPVDFVTAATNELAGSSTSAQYGPPYNNGSGSVQSWWVLHPQAWAGVHQPVDQPNDFVLAPLQSAVPGDASLRTALATFTGASGDRQSGWLDNYTKALGKASVKSGEVATAEGDYGPVPLLMSRLLGVARSGGLDGLLLTNGNFYQTDYTKPLLFMGDGSHLSGLAQDQKLTGNLWGMMNETGRYPGQSWLWLYTLWYQIAPFNASSNADLLVVLVMVGATTLLLLVPFIPGLRDIPRWIPIHRLIWRRYYAEQAAGRGART
ncbi:MAG: hypothetical protein E6J14_11850 [Chloroflexi bacterium]|nr:MAG: hypothetical protein E6J14_11850 [Chloroflexota bacterium]